MSAQAKVFASPELLAAILLFLPLKDLLFFQRVSHFSHTLINTAPALQQALHISVDSRSAGRSKSSASGPSVNPLLAQRFPCFFPGYYGKNLHALSAEDIKQCFWTDNDNRIAAITRHGASWRHMLPTDRAIKAIVVHKTSSAMGGSSSSYRWKAGARADGLVTMGQIYDVCASWVLLEHPVACFKVHWNYPWAADGVEGEIWHKELKELRKDEVVRIGLRYVVQCTGEEIRDVNAADFICEAKAIDNESFANITEEFHPLGRNSRGNEDLYD